MATCTAIFRLNEQSFDYLPLPSVRRNSCSATPNLFCTIVSRLNRRQQAVATYTVLCQFPRRHSKMEGEIEQAESVTSVSAKHCIAELLEPVVTRPPCCIFFWSSCTSSKMSWILTECKVFNSCLDLMRLCPLGVLHCYLERQRAVMMRVHEDLSFVTVQRPHALQPYLRSARSIYSQTRDVGLRTTQV